MTDYVSTPPPEPRPGTRFPEEPFMPARPLPCPDRLDTIAPELYDLVAGLPGVPSELTSLAETIDRMPDIGRLRASHAELLAAAKMIILRLPRQGQTNDIRACFTKLRAAIANAEEYYDSNDR